MPLLVATDVSVVIQGAHTQPEALVEIAAHPDLEDSGDTLEVFCVVPLPPGVVLHAGSIGLTQPVPSFGHCLAAVECRDCESY